MEYSKTSNRLNEKIAAIDDGRDPEIEYLIIKNLKNEKFSILDIGANLGSSAYYFLKNQPYATVYSFEPNTKLLPCLNRVQKIFSDRMKIFSFGLGDKNCKSKLYVPITSENYYSGLGSLNEKIAMESYNSLCGIKIFEPFEKLDVIDVQIYQADLLELPSDCRFVKIDIEGYEEKCIGGMINFLKCVKPIIVVEAINNIEKITSLLSETFVKTDILNILDAEYIPNYTGSSRNAIFVPVDSLWKTWLKSGDSYEL